MSIKCIFVGQSNISDAPYIGANGNWFVNNVDTGVSAAGIAGNDGATPYIGANGNWFINSTDTGLSSKGTNGLDGISPHIDNTTGHWFIGTADTGVPARGPAGADGRDGVDGQDAIAAINPCGDYDSNAVYSRNDYITYIDGNSYVYKSATPTFGNPPVGGGVSDPYWQLLALRGAPGLNGETPRIDATTGTWVIGTTDTGVKASGNNGADGLTPTIGANGNWYIGTTNTGVAAAANDGATPTIGANGNWFIRGVDTGVQAAGKDGVTPSIGANGHWIIDGVDTGVSAEGADGATPQIGNNKNWIIAGVDTGILAEGTNGTDGITPHIGDNGNWFIGTTDTGVKAQGVKGDDGAPATINGVSTLSIVEGDNIRIEQTGSTLKINSLGGGASSGTGEVASEVFTIVLPATDWEDNDIEVSDSHFLSGNYLYDINTTDANFYICGIQFDDITVDGKATAHCVNTPEQDITLTIVRIAATQVISGGGGGGVTKEYVDNAIAAAIGGAISSEY